MTIRTNTTIVDNTRDLMAALAPVTGTRTTAQVLVRATGADVLLPCNWALLPLAGDTPLDALPFKVGAGPLEATYSNGKRQAIDSEPAAKSWWTVTQGGTMVEVVSIVGGVRHNLAPGTRFAFDPPVPGLAVEVVAPQGATGGTDPVMFGGAKGVVAFEQMTGGDATLDAFRAALQGTPGVVIVWDSSAPADGSTQSTLNRGSARAGTDRAFYKENFNIFIVSSRLDGNRARAGEGLKLMEMVTELLTDRRSVDGEVFSSPAGVQVRGRSRITGGGAAFQALYVYLVQVSVTSALTRYDERTWTEWLRTHMDVNTYETAPSGAEKQVVSVDVDMSQPAE